ncbi:BRCA1-A complex subunit Abraxas 1-like isoform X2 [Myxocyprinus asiaticus]|uniref:BRCA1-A complex subunit Abraxas 1-like isoform X2 n=1 Tax=Myxocyprinus asiaticus TaxID=70543 RepID=UPI002221471D|nr:BRCA1-A complex subunit Abraxas 1-like isoform X2 [Myxocyprinus asiaticus]
MEEYNTTVRMSGFILSSLMFHHLNSDADVEGLILGESVGEENCRITDSQIDQIQFEHTINIQKHIPCRKLHSFYNNVGDVSEQKLRQMLSEYKEATASVSTHRLEFSTFIWHSSQYISIPIFVSNLGNLEQQDYWRLPAMCPSLEQSQAVNKHRTKFFCSRDDLKEVRNVSDMNDALFAEMQKMCEEVERSERAVEKLQEDIALLKDSMRKQKRHLDKNETQKCASPEKPKENILLCSSLGMLFPDAPSLRTQTLTVQGFPVLELCCNTNHGIDIPTKLPLIVENQHTKRKFDRAPRLRKKCLVAGFSQRLKRKRNTNDLGEPASESGSDTEIDVNGQSRSNSPVF